MSQFSYLTPKTIEEAISMYFEKSDKKSIYMAGGTDVLLKIKEGKFSPNRIISLKHVMEHNTIKIDPETGNLIIGAFVTHRELETSNLIRQKYKIIHDAAKNIGSIQIRNVATVGGNLVNAVPSADSAIPLITLDSFVRVMGRQGQRNIDLIDFFVAPGRTLLKSGEILLDIIIPKPPSFTAGAYKKFTRRAAMELPIVGIGITVSLERNSNICNKVRICLGVAGPTPMRALNAENFLIGKVITEALLNEAGCLASSESKVRDSIRGKLWHRKELIKVFVKRMGMLAIERIKLQKS